MPDETRASKDPLARRLRMGVKNEPVDEHFLNRPLGEVDYGSDGAKLNLGDLELSLAFEPVDWHSIEPDVYESYEWHGGALRYIYNLKDFNLKDKDDKHSVKLHELVPEGTVVFFDPTGNIDRSFKK